MKLFDFFKKRVRKAVRRLPIPGRRDFDAGKLTRLTADLPTSSETIDSYLHRQIVTLRARARDLAINNDYANKFLSMVKSNVLGDRGITLKNKAMDMPMGMNGTPRLDEVANKRIEDAWKQWSKAKNCTVSKDLTWREVQCIILETIATDGECFIRKVTPFDNEFNFAIELIDADLCDHTVNHSLPGGNIVRLGVEKNDWKQRVAYHMLRTNPNDTTLQYAPRKHQVIPADRVVHAFLQRKIGQTRGYPWLAVSMEPLGMLGGYEEAELVASRIAASKMGFFKTTGDAQYQGEDDGSGNILMEAQPGAFEQLPQNVDLTTFDPQHPGSNYANFVKACLRRIAAGLGVSYNTLANDLEGVNFSSGRLGLMDEREMWRLLQDWFSNHIHTPIFEEWLEIGLVNGNLGLPTSKYDKFNSPNWHGRRWVWVDPTKEVNAKVTELNAGLTSHTRILSELGIDEDELLDEIAAFKEKAAARGLNLSEVPAIQSENDGEMSGEEISED